MNFGDAIECLKLGHKVARRGWNGRGMFIYLVNGRSVQYELLKNEAAKAFESTKEVNKGRVLKINPHIDMRAADGSIVVGWLASQTDMMADDWILIR